jgi:hypothetical protein
LLVRDGERLSVPGLEAALMKLDGIWSAFFSPGGPMADRST